MFSYTGACAAEDAVRECFVENDAEFVPELEFDLTIVVVSMLNSDGICGGKGERVRARTSVGKSTISPTFSNIPSVTMNRLVRGLLAFSLVTFCSTLFKSSMSLCSYHFTVLLEICIPFRTA
jgi:hypothetical protein